MTKGSSTQSQSFSYPIFFSLFFRKHGVISRNICVHMKPLKPAQNDVVYMPDHYVVL